MTTKNRPSLDDLVPLVMIDDENVNENDDNLSHECEKEVLRHFESGDIVLIRLNCQCLPAIVFNINGLVMKINIDRQLYHVCLLDKQFTEYWVDAMDMIMFSVPMVAECENEQMTAMWLTANELLLKSNGSDDKIRLEEFKTRYIQVRHQQASFLSLNNSTSEEKSNSDKAQKLTAKKIIYPQLTNCEELHIIDSIYRSLKSTYTEARHVAEDTFIKIICTNNRENMSMSPIKNISDEWFLEFLSRRIDYFRQYSASWLPDLEAMAHNAENKNDLSTAISLMKA